LKLKSLKKKFYLYGDYEEIFRKKESAILISNHQSTADWLVSNMLAIRQGSLGHIRFIMKNGLKYFPIFGLYWQLVSKLNRKYFFI
jgi:lysophosphatidiate acyltransferase